MRRILILSALVLFFQACIEEKKPDPLPGIALELAQDRKANFSEIEYDLFFSIPDTKEEAIDAELTVSFVSTKSMDLILDFNVPSDHLKEVFLEGKPIEHRFVNEHVVVPAKYIQDGKNEIALTFRAGDQSLNRNDDFLYTLFVPDRASTCFPVFDQPDLKAVFKLTLEVPDTWKALSNGSSINSAEEEGRKTISFSPSAEISTYLFAFTAGEFLEETWEKDGRTMTMFHRETDSIKVMRNRDEIFELHAASLAWLEEYTSIEYPFEKFDFALLPPFQYGGMEHPGSIFYRQRSLMLDESATINQKLGRASLIAHETAHMWFGDLVTMEWFSDVWLKEVFANFMAAKIVNPQFPEVDHDLRFLLAHYPSAYGIDRTRGTHPIRQELANLKNAGTLYGPIIYQKAPIVMKQLELLIGEETMQKSLAEYLANFSFGNATWDDLVEIIDANHEADIKEWSRKWVYQTGIPIIDHQEDRITHNTETWRVQQFETQSIGESTKTLPIQINSPDQETQIGSSIFLPNSNGLGYGYFPLSEQSLDYIFENLNTLEDPVLRGSVWINLNEAMLRGDLHPLDLMELAIQTLPGEDNPLVLSRVLGYSQSIFWGFLTAEQRKGVVEPWESLLLDQMRTTEVQGAVTMYFRAFRNTVLSEEGIDTFLRIHNGELEMPGLRLSENDRITNSYELSVRGHDEADEIMNSVLESISNIDRKRQMEFTMPALSPDPAVRKEKFFSLLDPVNRENEPWVGDVLRYLNHPLRGDERLAYVLPALEELEEIQITGDIFFPQRWLGSVLGGHNSAETADIIKTFLEERPDYPEKLKNKILQSADRVERASIIDN